MFSVRVGRTGAASVIINDAVIDSFWSPGGMVSDNTKEMARRTARYARLQAPVRSGTLRRGTRADPGHDRVGRRHHVSYVRSRAHYAYFVHEGRGPIMGKITRKGPIVKMSGPNPGPRSLGKWQPGMAPNGKWPNVVRGPVAAQRGAPFLSRGMAFAFGVSGAAVRFR